MAEEKILGKIAKLLELGDETRGGTQAERELATQRAHELMLKYNIEQHEITGRAAASDIKKDDGTVIVGQQAMWKVALINMIADPLFCIGYFRIIGNHEWRVFVIGRHENVSFVHQLSELLIPQLEREAASAFSRARELDPEVMPRSFRRAFYYQATVVIRARLEQEQDEAVGDGPGTDLVRNESSALSKFMFKENIYLRNAQHGNYGDELGRRAGQAAGLTADISVGKKLA